MINENKETREFEDNNDPDLDPAAYGDFDFKKAIGRGGTLKWDGMLHEEVDKIGWDGVRKRLARETGQDINDTMYYYPPNEKQ